MKRPQRLFVSLLLAALLTPLLPAAQAATPDAEPWAPYNAQAPVDAVALAGEGTTLAAALAAPVSRTTGCDAVTGGVGCVPSNVATTDLAILSTEYGFARNGTGFSPTAYGRTHVAVSRDGSAIASLGRDTQPSAQTGGTGGIPDPTELDPESPPGAPTPSAGANATRLRLAYNRIPAGGNWSTVATPVNLSYFLDGAAYGLLMSADGNRMVVATNLDANMTLRGFSYGSGTLQPAFSYTAAGNVSAIAASSDLATILMVGQVVAGDAKYGFVHLFGFGLSAPTATYLDAFNGTAFRSAAVSADGTRLLAGRNDGNLLVFQRATFQAPQSLVLGGAADTVTHVATSEDGRRIAAVANKTLTLLGGDAAALSTLWTANLTGDTRGLAVNRTGGLVYVGTVGSGAGLSAYAEDSTPLWTMAGEARALSINREGDRIAFGRTTLVNAIHLTRNVSLEAAGGGKIVASKAVKPGGSASFELTIRNTGTGPERIAFEAPASLRLSAEPGDVYVRPDEAKRVNLTVEVGPEFSGTRIFDVVARSTSSGARDNITLTLTLQGTTAVSLFVNETDLNAAPGQPTTFLLGIRNSGTKDAAIGIRTQQAVSAGVPWDLKVEPTSLTIPPTSVTTARVTVTPPADTPNGTNDHITFILEGPGIADQATVTLRINPHLAVEVSANKRVQFVEPGKTAIFNVSVKNTGTIGRAFEVYYEPVSTSGRGSWAVDMETGSFRLDPGAARNVAVRILAPADVTTSDRMSVLVTARSLPEEVNESAVIGNVTLFANGAVAPPTPTTTNPNEIPFTGPALVAAALAALAVLRRRRA